MINLTKAPFFLVKEDIEWVENTKSNDVRRKIGQLFVPIGYSGDADYLEHVMLSHHIGGIMYRCGEAKEMQRTHRYLQEHSKFHFWSELILRMVDVELQRMEHSTENRCRQLQPEIPRTPIV